MAHDFGAVSCFEAHLYRLHFGDRRLCLSGLERQLESPLEQGAPDVDRAKLGFQVLLLPRLLLLFLYDSMKQLSHVV